MICRSVGMLITLFVIGCAVEGDPQTAPAPGPQPAASIDDGSASPGEIVEPAEMTQAKFDLPESIETETVDAGAVSTKTIVMNVPGMH